MLKIHRRPHFISQTRAFSLFIAILSLCIFLSLPALATTPISADLRTPNPNANLTLNLTKTEYFLTLSSTGNLNLTLSPTAEGKVSAVKDTLTIKTNSSAGYQLFLSVQGANPNDNRLTNNSDPSHYFSPTTGTITAPIALENNQWGFAISKSTPNAIPNNFDPSYNLAGDLNSAKFALIPTKNHQSLLQNTTTANATTQSDPGTNLDIYYATKANHQTPSGNYTNTLVYTAIANTVEIIEPTFEGITTMQEMTHDICNNETTPHAFVGGGTSGTILSATTRTHTADKNFIPEAELTDTRDGKKYTIRKLADGNCWMVKNLDLGNTGQSLTLTSSDSDVASSFTLNNISNPGASWPTSTNQSNVDTVRVIDDGDKWLINVSQGNNETLASNEPSDPELKLRHIGNYYNYYTATAGSGSYSMSSGNASYSICPKGWRLPFGKNTNTDKSFQKLTDKYNLTQGSYIDSNTEVSYKFRSKPFSFPFSGLYWSASVNVQGSYGYFWSSTVYSSDRARHLYQRTSYLNPQNDYNKMQGFAIRCVAR